MPPTSFRCARRADALWTRSILRLDAPARRFPSGCAPGYCYSSAGRQTFRDPQSEQRKCTSSSRLPSPQSAIASIIVISLECRQPPDAIAAPTHEIINPSAPQARASPTVILLPKVVSPTTPCSAQIVLRVMSSKWPPSEPNSPFEFFSQAAGIRRRLPFDNTGPSR